MKIYEKPRLVALSLEGNERLCGDCAENNAAHLLYQDEGFASMLLSAFNPALLEDGVSKSDFEVLFDVGSSCTTQVIGYCKFTTSDNLVAWS